MFHFFGTVGFGLDADQPPQRLVASQFRQAGFGGRVPQGDAQHDDAPEHVRRDSRCVPCRVPSQRLEQLAVGNGARSCLIVLSEGLSSRQSQAKRGLGEA